jgi:hypothetical protein
LIGLSLSLSLLATLDGWVPWNGEYDMKAFTFFYGGMVGGLLIGWLAGVWDMQLSALILCSLWCDVFVWVEL